MNETLADSGLNVEKRLSAPASVLPKKTVIAGSRGRMGAMLMGRGAGAGLEMAGIDLPFAAGDMANACQDADLLLLCVPAPRLEGLVKKLVSFLPPHAVLGDITSVKENPMRQMEKHWPGAVVGAHPLFGPKSLPGQDMPVAITPGKRASAKDAALVKSFFQKLGCRVFETTPEKHDMAMARIQNLNFITNVAYFAALAGQEDLLPFLTPSFERRRKAAEKMLTEDGEMFSGLVEANPHSQEAARQFRRLLDLAASGDIQLLCKRAQWWFDNWDSAEERN